MPAPGCHNSTATRRDDERDNRDHLEIDQRLDRNAPDPLHVVHAATP